MKRIHYCYLLMRALPEGGCRYYVGIRTAPEGKTPESDTKYMGGGPWIRRAVKAHPGEFSKTIVEEFETIDEAKALERSLVGLTTANSPYSYNLVEGGGSGGLASEATKAKNRVATLAQFDDPENAARHTAATTEANRAKAKDPAWQEAHAAARRTPESRKKSSAGTATWWANATDERKAVRTAEQEEGRRRSRTRRRALDALAIAHGLADVVEEQRAARVAAQQDGKRRAKRVRREVALIFLALVALVAARAA